MSSNLKSESYDVIVIGGGFYGCCVALLFREYYDRVLIIEREPELLSRASLINQARVHNGYHYPRSYLTALRSHLNFPQFVANFPECIDSSFEKVYPIARLHSKVNAFQFRKTFSDLGAPVSTAPKHIKSLFNSRLIEEVFYVKEYAFDAVKLRAILKQKITNAGIDTLYNTSAQKLSSTLHQTLNVHLSEGVTLYSQQVINCAYAGINNLLANSQLPLLPMKYELTELALIEVPSTLKQLGVTLMDGPFFSTMPFPSRGLHSISHVRYTPHEAWQYAEQPQATAYAKPLKRTSNAIFMLKDAQRYLPLLKEAIPADALFEVKTILLQNEVDDGRPILFRENYGWPNHSLIMGGKIDNIYDILKKIEDSNLIPKKTRAVASHLF